ncbi:hypothetical protein [Nocardioides albertanoniae]|uniref:hypothetical protein n=1 Tax=Nocardioides albertanoniae TaxID=1175486 RepID=UPI00147760AF|nr:hypothetical protein [Nocardioides albertanoniae]
MDALWADGESLGGFRDTESGHCLNPLKSSMIAEILSKSLGFRQYIDERFADYERTGVLVDPS